MTNRFISTLVTIRPTLIVLLLLYFPSGYTAEQPEGKWHNTGAAKTAVFIGGAEGGEAWSWFPQQIQGLKEQGFNVYQTEYFRYPETFLENIDLQYFVAVIKWLTETQQQTEINVIAHSRGTEAATWLASQHNAITKLVLIAPASHFFQGVQPSLEATFEQPTSAWRNGQKNIAFVPYNVNDELKQQTIEYAMKGQLCPCSKAVYEASIKSANKGTDLPVNTIKANVLLVAADDDPVWPALPMAKALKSRMENAGIHAELTSVKGGHTLHQEPKVWQKISAFVSQ